MNYLINFATVLSHSALLHSAWPVILPFDCGGHGGRGAGQGGEGMEVCVWRVSGF